MTLAGKQRLVVGVLAVLAVWPLAHRALVWRYDLDPWRFFGWAMYCTPKLPIDVSLFAVEDGARVPVELASLTRAQRGAIVSLRRHRSVWGTLASPARAGAALLDARPNATAVEIVLDKWYLDPATSTIAIHSETHHFDRASRRGPPATGTISGWQTPSALDY